MEEKLNIIDTIVVEVNDLIDAKGIDKCRLAIDIIQKLSLLRSTIVNETEDTKNA